MKMLTVMTAGMLLLSTITPNQAAPVPNTPEKPSHDFTTPYGSIRVDDDVCDSIGDQAIFIMPDGSFTVGDTCAEAVKRYMMSVRRKQPRA